MNIAFREEQVLLSAQVKVVDDDLTVARTWLRTGCGDLSEAIIEGIIPSVEVGEQVLEEDDLSELLLLHKVAERQDSRDDRSDEGHPVDCGEHENRTDAERRRENSNPRIVPEDHLTVHPLPFRRPNYN